MENNFFDFAKTKEALSQLSADLSGLTAAIAQKGVEIENNRNAKSTEIEEYKNKLASTQSKVKKACDTIDSINKYIDGVL